MDKLFKLDHILIWVDKDAPEIEFFKEKGFTSIIAGSHPQQGTSGKYLFFLNFYIELLYISDKSEALGNIENFGCNYIERSDWRLNQVSSPFGLALKMEIFDKEKILFDYTEYKAGWMKDDGLLMADSNKYLPSPLVFVLRPKMEFPCYHSVEEMLKDDKPDDFKKNHMHENGIKTLTSYNINICPGSEPSGLANYLSSNGINILQGDKNCIELVFDNGIKNREIDFREGLPLIIKY